MKFLQESTRKTSSKNKAADERRNDKQARAAQPLRPARDSTWDDVDNELTDEWFAAWYQAIEELKAGKIKLDAENEVSTISCYRTRSYWEAVLSLRVIILNGNHDK